MPEVRQIHKFYTLSKLIIFTSTAEFFLAASPPLMTEMELRIETMVLIRH